MAKKMFSKRVLAIVLSLVMCVSAVQLGAFAEKQDSQVMNGYFVLDENGNVLGTADSSAVTKNGFTVSKTIAQTGENAFDITLEVQTSQTVTTAASAIQLVIDRSNSMDYCADCGSEYPSFCGCKAGTRMGAVRSAITGEGGFLDKLLAQNKGKLYISVLVFSGSASSSSVEDAETVLGWTELTANSKRSIASVVNSISPDGGTNLDAGLTLAANRLQMDEIASVSNKYTVLLTDGAPTYHTGGSETSTQEINGTKGNGSSASDDTIAAGINAASRVKALSTLYTICFGVADEQLRQAEYVCTHCGEQEDEHVSLCVRCLQPKNRHTGGNKNNCPDRSGSKYQRGRFCDENGTTRYTPTVTGGLTVGQYLSSSIASSGSSYDADDMDGVYSAFSNVASSAISGMTGAGTTVTDPMGQFVTLGDTSALKGVSASEDTLTWKLDADTLVGTAVSGNTTTYTYRITYPITLDTAAEGFREYTETGDIQYHPTNGYTYLSVVTDSGSVQVPFNVPGVRGTVPTLSYTVEYYLQADAAAGDYAHYTLEDSAAPAAVKAWSLVNAPEGYAGFYASRYYAFAHGEDQLQVIPGGDNVIRLYYDRIPATVTVNHFYKTDVVNASGSTVSGTYPEAPQKSGSATLYAGDPYTAIADPSFDGEVYVLQSADPQMTITLTAGSNVIDLYYARTLNTYAYSVIYNGNGGILENGRSSYGDSQNVQDTFAVSHTVHADGNTFVREHYDFIGWNTKPDGTGTAYTVSEAILLTPSANTKTLCAQWKEHPKYDYTVIYNANFGKNPETAADSQNIADTYAAAYDIDVDANGFDRANYDFIGWATSPDGDVVYQSGDTIRFHNGGSQILYARWVEHDKYAYSLIYNGNGGALANGDMAYGDSENTTETYATTYAIGVDANTFLRESHTFTGWNTKPDGTGTAYAIDSKVALTPENNTQTLYAQWDEHPKYDYSLVYNANFGENPDTLADTQNITGTYATTYAIGVDANTFLRENYTFTGWNTRPDGFGTSYAVDADVLLTPENNAQILYAQWQENPKFDYTVTYNANFGEDPATAEDSQNITGIYSRTYSIGVDANPFTRINYTFTGWNTQPDGSGADYPVGGFVALTAAFNTETLYAQWEMNPRYDYTLVYDANFGTPTEIKLDSESVNEIFDLTHTVSVDMNSFLRENHTFTGWNTEADGSGESVAIGAKVQLTAENNIEILYAQWQLNPIYDYTLIYNANFGENPATAADSENVTGTFADFHSIGVDANPFIRENHTFLGWAVEPEGEVRYQAGDGFLFIGSGEKVLYAKWQEDDKLAYSLIYNGNGGVLPGGDMAYGDSENVTETYETSHAVGVDENTFSREHYTFAGWNTAADGSGTAYSAYDVITLNVEIPTQTLYAQWTVNEYPYLVAYLTRVDGNAYQSFTGTLPADAPTGGMLPYGEVIDVAALEVPADLTDDLYTYGYTAIDTVINPDGSVIVMVYYTYYTPADLDPPPQDEDNDPGTPDNDPGDGLVYIEEEQIPLAEVPKTGDPLVLYAGLTALSGAGLAAMGLLKKKKEETDGE